MTTTPDSSTAYAFKVALAPAWEAVLPQAARRAEALGLVWPAALQAHRLPRIYAATLVGRCRVDSDVTALAYDVVAWEPPREFVLHAQLDALAGLQLDFGLGPRRTLRAANPGADVDVGALGLRLDAEGLFFAAATRPADGAALPPERLDRVPMAAVLSAFVAVASRRLRLVHRGADHIVDKYDPPEALAGLALSRWRGDAAYRLAGPLLRLEVTVAAAPP